MHKNEALFFVQIAIQFLVDKRTKKRYIIYIKKSKKQVHERQLKMRFKQSEVQGIIRSTYGNNAVAIGSNEDDGILTIFWLYKGEDEEDVKVLTLNL